MLQVLIELLFDTIVLVEPELFVLEMIDEVFELTELFTFDDDEIFDDTPSPAVALTVPEGDEMTADDWAATYAPEIPRASPAPTIKALILLRMSSSVRGSICLLRA